MKAKLVRLDGTTVEVEGTEAEVQKVLQALSPAPVVNWTYPSWNGWHYWPYWQSPYYTNTGTTFTVPNVKYNVTSGTSVTPGGSFTLTNGGTTTVPLKVDSTTDAPPAVWSSWLVQNTAAGPAATQLTYPTACGSSFTMNPTWNGTCTLPTSTGVLKSA